MSEEHIALEQFAELFLLFPDYTDRDWSRILVEERLVEGRLYGAESEISREERERHAQAWVSRLRGAIDDVGLRREWQPRKTEQGSPAKLGISCSGGGVRAATYSLGALQALTQQGEFQKARYLSAVSGGGYVAASYATVAKTSSVPVPLEPGGSEDPWIFQPETAGQAGSPEARYLRNNSSYLLPSVGMYLWGIWRILLGLTMNLIGIALILLLVGLPLGNMLKQDYLYPNLGTVDCRSIDPEAYLSDKGLSGEDRSARLENRLDREATEAEAEAACEDGTWTPDYRDSLSRTRVDVPRAGTWWIVLAAAGIALVPGLVLIAVGHPPRRRRALKRATILGSVVLSATVLVFVILPYLVNLLLVPSEVAFRGLDGITRAVVGWMNQFKGVLAAVGIGGTAAGVAAAAGAAKPHRLVRLAVYAASLLVPLMAFAGLVWFASIGAKGINWLVWLGLLIVLLVLLGSVSARDSSLHPTYRRRLTFGYRVRRQSASTLRTAKPGMEDELDFELDSEDEDIYGVKPAGRGADLLSTYAYQSGRSHEPPELILCGTVNLSDVGSAPSGRHGASFTFSGAEIRMPGITIPTVDLENQLSLRNRESFTLEAARAIVGAAVSPGMGKAHSKMWPFRSLLALGNVRLGVWLPNPDWVQYQSRFASRPRFHYLFREMFGLHSRSAPFVYVTDGGHWEVLGLVELLRRGCTEIYCLDASGDDQDQYAAIGKAVAIARSDLGVEIDLRIETMLPDPPLASADSEEDPPPLRSKRNHLCGKITYPDGTEGILVYCKAAVRDGDPADVLAYQDRYPDYPSHSTGDQLFDHEQFEAYRKIGHAAGMDAVSTMSDARDNGRSCTDDAAGLAAAPEQT
ncbi:MAG: hypothetical protein GY788_03600 [bacterium]|nr:hypothetical protein [bacterium]